jgi:hypothetical protein
VVGSPTAAGAHGEGGGSLKWMWQHRAVGMAARLLFLSTKYMRVGRECDGRGVVPDRALVDGGHRPWRLGGVWCTAAA